MADAVRAQKEAEERCLDLHAEIQYRAWMPRSDGGGKRLHHRQCSQRLCATDAIGPCWRFIHADKVQFYCY